MSKISGMLPASLKNSLLRIYYIPTRISDRIYTLASHGKIPFPDKAFQKWDYKVFTGKKPDLKNPVLFNEKLQWMKYYYRNPALTPLVDKYEVRKYVAQKAGTDILVNNYGVFDRWEDIDIDKLPDRFVMKCTHDSGSVSICKDKKTWDKEAAEKMMRNGLATKQFYLSREWPYKNVTPRITVEQYVCNSDGTPMTDYKFFCFDGEPVIVDVLTGRHTPGGIREDFFDMDWKHLDAQKKRQPNADVSPEKPACFEKMYEIAKKLSPGFPFIRVDFFVADSKPYFTELTMYNDGGRVPFDPESFEIWLGSLLKLPPVMR